MSFMNIDKHLKLGDKILVHCTGGISRSPTLCASFLMKRNN